MSIVVYGTGWCPDCRRAKQFLGEQRVAYEYVDVDADAAGLAVVHRVNQGKTIIPTIVFDDGSTLVEPSNAELADKLGLQTHASRSYYDLLVVGSGPCGLTAALYAAREGIDTLVIERAAVGGQVGVTERLDNFPGFPDGVGGAELAERLRRQAERFGVEILAATEVAAVGVDGTDRTVTTSRGQTYRAPALLLATGSHYRRLGIPGESDLVGAGVHFCATCDGPFYRDQPVAVIGGGNSAGEESLFLTRFASSVTLVTRDSQLTASRSVAEKVLADPSISVVSGSRPVQLVGDGAHLTSVILEDIGSGTRSVLEVPAVFVFIGLTPNSRLVTDLVDLDPAGFVVTDVGLSTSVPGVFAAGDVRCGSTKQAASAAGEGAAAALAIRRYLQSRVSAMRPCG